MTSIKFTFKCNCSKCKRFRIRFIGLPKEMELGCSGMAEEDPVEDPDITFSYFNPRTLWVEKKCPIPSWWTDSIWWVWKYCTAVKSSSGRCELAFIAPEDGDGWIEFSCCKDACKLRVMYQQYEDKNSSWTI